MAGPLLPPQFVWALSERGLAQRLVDLASMSFVQGEHPFARQTFFRDLETIDPLMPEGGEIERELVLDGGDTQRLLRGDGWRVHLVLLKRRPEVQVLVTAKTAELADSVLDDIRKAAPQVSRAGAQSRLTMWTAGTGGSPSRYRRWVDAPAWTSIARNYPIDVRNAIEPVMQMTEAPAQGGRLILWYGEPGTGKTTAIRSMAQEWQAWADVHFVLDPEAFFGGPDYLMHVVSDEDGWDLLSQGNRRWKLLVVEDADDLIRADARQQSGASLGRLLNLTDGILGHGMRVLLLITTNEPMRGLHPAVIRPGRCLADVHFRALSHTEAVEWLDGDAQGVVVPGGEVTLAELYRLRGDVFTINSERPTESSTRYL